jgi:cytoskeletal protein RodZ
MTSRISCSSLCSSRKLWLAAIALGGIGLFSLSNADAQKPKAADEKHVGEKHVHSAEEHARGVTALKQAFGNSQIDVYFQMGDLETLKPELADVKFVDAVDVTGKELLRFEQANGDSWLIDPDTVFTYRMRKGKAK